MAPLHYLNAMHGTQNYTEQQETFGVFFFSSTNQIFLFELWEEW